MGTLLVEGGDEDRGAVESEDMGEAGADEGEKLGLEGAEAADTICEEEEDERFRTKRTWRSAWTAANMSEIISLSCEKADKSDSICTRKPILLSKHSTTGLSTERKR